jgi:archaemetzincin
VAGIAIWWIGEAAVEERVLDEVRAEVERAMEVPTRIWTSAARPSGTLDPVRGQHSSSRILHWLSSARPDGAGTLIAVTDADLFIPVLTFVFGEAALGGGLAVVSTARLGTDASGARTDRRRLVGRLAKECVHELGHAVGLVHCAEPACVMARSASLRHVDAKSGALCRNCRLHLRELWRQESGAHG